MTAITVAVCFGLLHFRAIFPVRASAELMPGQTWIIRGSESSDIEIRSEYPISVREGNCFVPRTAEIRLTCPAADVEITDARPALLIWAASNRVTFTGR